MSRREITPADVAFGIFLALVGNAFILYAMGALWL